jgi:mono/diheme cytochrome c family protein
VALDPNGGAGDLHEVSIEGNEMKRTKLLVAIVTGIAAAPGLLFYESTTAAQAKSSQLALKATKPTAAELSAGKKLYETTCAACHGNHGQGTVLAPGLKTLPRAKTINGVVEQLTKPLERTTGTKMPNFNAKYAKKEKEELGAYVTVDISKTVK